MTATETRLVPHVTSEVGRLREVIVHRPGLELDRLTPSNASSFLFDDVLWADRARNEHDAFAQQLSERDVVVHHFDELLTGALESIEGREFVLDRIVTDEQFDPTLAPEVRRLFDDTDADGRRRPSRRPRRIRTEILT